MKSPLKKRMMTCDVCGHQWEATIGGYDVQMNTLDDLLYFKREEESRKCPKCYGKEKNMANSESPEKTPFLLQEPRYTMEKSVVLPPKSKLQIEEALIKIRYFHKIYDDWNFKSVDAGGAGTVLNFYGKAGTGKTLTAEALAGSLGKKFISLGMSDIESKYMGETAKNIRSAFLCAEKENAVLFFDEADTLLGARLSNVSQGIDNEVNSLRSTILIELEKFTGIVIFATNFEKNYDRAFVSRITQHVFFDLPDLEGRKKIWEKFLIQDIPLDGCREEILLKLAEQTEGFSGRNIRTTMRLALPKAIISAQNINEAVLKWTHLEEAIDQVRLQESIGTEVGGCRLKPETKAGLAALGVKIESK